MRDRSTRLLLARVDPRVGAFFRRLNERSRGPSLGMALVAASVIALVLGMMLSAMQEPTWGAQSLIVSLCTIIALVVMDMNLVLLPAMVAITTGQIAREDIKEGQLEMLALTNIPGRVVFQAYALSGLYRLRVALALGLAAVPLAALQFGSAVGWPSEALPDVAYWLLAGMVALGLWGMNLVGAAVGVSLALRRQSAAVIALIALTVMLVVTCGPLYLVWNLIGPLRGTAISSLKPLGILLWIAILLLSAAPYVAAWRSWSAERRLI